MKATITAGSFFLLFLLAGCQEEEKTFSSIVGEWQGTLAEIRVTPQGLPIPISEQDESFATRIEFREEGTMILIDDAQPTEGTYQVADNKLIADIDFAIDGFDLSGTYTLETLTENTLIISIERYDTIADPNGGPSVSGKVKVTLHFRKL